MSLVTEPTAVPTAEPANEQFMTGVQAAARVVIDQVRADRDAGRSVAGFVSGYPGSPLGGFDQELQRHRRELDELGMVHRPGLNEELAVTAVMGSQVAATFTDARHDGVLGVWYGKAPGVDRAADALRHAAFVGTSRQGGALALVGDDPANKSSTLPSSSERLLAELCMPVLFPGTVQEVLDYGAHAVAASRASGLWSALKLVSAVADGTGTGVASPDRFARIVPAGLELADPTHRVDAMMGTGRGDAAERLLVEKLAVARAYGVANRLNRVVVDAPGAWLGIMAAGHTYHAVVEALGALGLDLAALRDHGIRLIQLGMIFPLDHDQLRSMAAGLDTVVVVEEKRPFVEAVLKEALYGVTGAPEVLGKHDATGADLLAAWGTLDATALAPALRSVLATRIDPDRLRTPRSRAQGQLVVLDQAPQRTPFFCSGCPHSSSLKVPEGASVGVGIGCHGMVSLLPTSRVGRITGFTQMGGEGAQWIGIEPFVERDHLTQNLGDGTLAHSGYLAIRFAVASGAHLTYKVLYNTAVAMTGGQDAVGGMTVPHLCQALLAEGVTKIIVTTEDLDRYRGVRLPKGVELRSRDHLVAAQEELAKLPGVTVLIHDQECAAELRRRRKRGTATTPRHRIVIDERVCEGCGDCGVKSACLSLQPVQTELGRKTAIQQTSCNLDLSCLDGDCPSFLAVEPARPRRWARATTPAAGAGGATRRELPRPPRALPEPTLVVPADDVTIRMPGIGGTGVVTVAQVLGTAAGIDGRHVAGVDQTGLSQKAGPVLSELRISTGPTDQVGDTPDVVDVCIAMDLVVAVTPANLAGLVPGRSFVVGSTSTVPTGAMIVDPRLPLPDAAGLQRELEAHTRPGEAVWIDAAASTQALFGSSLNANVLLLGAAYQRGLIPVSAAAIEEAIGRNGSGAELNRAAFTWGRVAVADPAAFEAATRTAPVPERPLPAALAAQVEAIAAGDEATAQVVRFRVADLIGYHGEALAGSFLASVAEVAAAERALDPASRQLTQATARSLHKLMAYKDEYEVARLLLSPESRAQAEEVAGPGARVTWKLHPPVLRAMGRTRKISLGPWARPALGALRAGRRLRGTPVDPFGYARVRRVERALVADHQALCRQVAARLPEIGVAEATELVELVELVRGYEDVKLANVAAFEQAMATARARLGLS